MDSLRDYVGFMAGRGLVLDIAETVVKEDIPELIDRLSDRGRIILFSHVQGYDCRVVANLAPSQDALSMLLGGGSYAFFLEGVKKTEKTLLCGREGLENIDVRRGDLTSVLPMLKHCANDSGPFITTGIVSSIDPESGVVGRGVHRMEYRGGNRLGVALLNPPLIDIYNKYRAKGELMPLTVTIGVEPLLFLSMALKVGPERDKLEVAGGLKGEGVKVMKTIGSSMEVPWGAEFYLEGHVDPDDTRRDGPLGEISGYYLTIEGTPTMVVDLISHRPSPIYHALLPTSLEGDTYLTFVSRAHIEEGTKRLFPFVADIVFVQRTFGSTVVVSVGPTERARIRNLMLSMMAYPMIKKVVVVDADIDARNLNDVEWALVTRCEADRDIIITPGLQGQPIDPRTAQGSGVAKIGIDATMQGKNMEERARVIPGNGERIEKVLKSLGGE
jgi:2,5-furandicarboxylate decarboxylase 1